MSVVGLIKERLIIQTHGRVLEIYVEQLTRKLESSDASQQALECL